ncbi:hypothetical protein A5792_28305 [Mycolicibacterium peregrinum]|uniref:Transglycosylase SLT domain-containing protein n=1 Tax=Mycolicibacterium peregrinum TaxID=43304 RepID=A0A1A0QUQ2_MYCPR|nr:type VII secretion target [Mycolicibacterium peregrinum]OBB25648.1 hypothetical protein A5792_28305 [Mycolicibacterium peregrinum]
MTAQLRVEPAALKAVGSTIADIGTSLSGSDVGKALASLAGVARGFRSGEAGAQIGSAIDTASKKVSAAFVDYADNLKAAAEKYEKTDQSLAQKIKDKLKDLEGKDDGGDGKSPDKPQTPDATNDRDIDLSKLTPEQKELIKNFQLPESAVPPQFRDNIPEYRKNILEAAVKNGIPPEVLAAQIEQESGWNPDIQNSEGRDSWGLSQSEPGAWAQTPTGQAHPLTDTNRGTASDPRRNIAYAINAQAEYDRWCSEHGEPLYPNDPLRSMLDGYNGGIGNPQAAENQGYYQGIVERLHKYQIDPSVGVPKLGTPST